MGCHLRYAHLCFVQRNFEEFYTVVSILSQPFPHDRWPCDHPQVVLVESLALLHMREITASWSAFVLGISKGFCENQQEMKWSMPWDLSVHNMSLPFDHTCCLDKSELETCLRFPVSENRSRRLRSESFFLFPLLTTVQFDVVHQHLDLPHKQHTNS